MSFFDRNYKTPPWLNIKLTEQIKRRHFLKSAAGITALASMPIAAISPSKQHQIDLALTTDPWQTLNAVQDHLLPTSKSGPGASEIQALQYLYNVVYEQPTAQDEINFIYKGVGWLNDYCQSQLNKNFVVLTFEDKEKMLRNISRTRAGENWLNTLMGYIFEAMLSPPSYGGNPKGIGWQWLKHQPGFPLPAPGSRYYEIPATRGEVKLSNKQAEQPAVITVGKLKRKNKAIST